MFQAFLRLSVFGKVRAIHLCPIILRAEASQHWLERPALLCPLSGQPREVGIKQVHDINQLIRRENLKLSRCYGFYPKEDKFNEKSNKYFIEFHTEAGELVAVLPSESCSDINVESHDVDDYSEHALRQACSDIIACVKQADSTEPSARYNQ